MSLVVANSGVVSVEPLGIPWALFTGVATIWLVGLCCGVICATSCFRSKAKGTGPVVPQLRLDAWTRLTSRALRFVAKRRAVSLAFNSYRTVDLRNTPQAAPNQARRAHLRRRASTPSTRTALAHEGPILAVNNGSDGSRAGAHHYTR